MHRVRLQCRTGPVLGAKQQAQGRHLNRVTVYDFAKGEGAWQERREKGRFKTVILIKNKERFEIPHGAH